MENPWKTLQKARVYSNPWIDVEHHDVLNPAGNPGIYGKVHYKNIAIGIIPIDDALNTYLVGQYRYTLDEYSWEIPEGGCPIGTSKLASAKRELLEETGIHAESYEEILKLHTSNAVCDEVAYIYVAKGLSFGEAQPEETEQIVTKKVSLDNAIQMINEGNITDAMSVAGLYKVYSILNDSL